MKAFSTLVLTALFTLAYSQAAYELGVLPSININKAINEQYKLNVKVESRQLLEQGFFKDEVPVIYDYELTDIALLGSKKIGHNRIAAGYQARFREGKYVHRLMQQYAITQQKYKYKLGHRIATDQTIQSNEKNVYRLRYRISGLFALSGQQIDENEFYIKANHEYLNQLQDNHYDLEIRLVPMLGHQFSKSNKLELGLDYRINSFIEQDSRSRFFIATNWYLSF